MESVSRPPHSRKHSTSTTASSSSLKNPYDDVLLSNGTKAKFEAHEYAEIFSGSSSIPVLDLSALNERVGSRDCRSSKLDYTNIFGGLRGDDVAVPYEQLFNGAVKKTKTRIPADIESPFREPGASDQSTDGFKQQFNVSFNKTSQRNSDESNWKTHIAQLHAVSGFTHFVDGTPLHNKSSLKREVSRTWSFSSGIEPMTLDKSCNVNGVNPKPCTSNRSPPSSHPFSPNDSKDFRQSRLPSFASRMSAGESLPPLLDEELDDDSVAAVSVAALKKAIEQAQESIKIAKMVMEKRKDGLRDGLKPGSKSLMKVKDKKATRICHFDAPEENNVIEIYRQLDPTSHTFTRNDNFLDAAKDHAVTDVGKKAPSCSQREILEPDEKVEVGNVAPPEAPGETKTFTGLVADAKCKTVTFESGKVDCCIEQMETGKETFEQRELTIHRLIGPEVVVESDLNTCRSVKELEKSVDEAFKQCLGTSDHIGPRSIGDQPERFRDCSESKQEQEMVIDEGGGNNVTVDKEKSETRFAGHEGMVHMEQFTVLKYGFDDLQNELGEKDVMEQADMDKKPGNICELKENEHDGKSSGEEENGIVLEEEEHQWFESEVQLTEPVNAVNEPKNVHKKLNHEHGQNETSDMSECEENPDEFDFQEAVSGKDIDEAVDAHCSMSGTIFSERQEPCNVDLNNFVQDYSMPLEPEMCLAVDENEERRSIHLELKEMPTTDSLRRCASEETFIESQPNSNFETSSEIHNAAQEYAAETNMPHLPESGNVDIKATESLDDKNAKPVSGRTSESDEESVLTAFRENTDKVSTNDEREERIDCLIMTPDEREYVGEQSKRVHSEDRSGDLFYQSNSEPKEMEKNKANPSRTSIVGLKDSKGNEQKYDANDHQQRVEAIKKGREREKDRMAVERAIREVRERAFAEARQRAMAEAREKLEKASVENKNPLDKTSNGAKLRAERAAVERATAEARERALEKAMSQKINTEARTHAEKYSTERLSTSSRNNGQKHSDVEKCDGGASESVQRRKARLERHQRIMERAAKALAEKNMRDLLAQKEQAERDRLAESLDADIKRWATGKERNLRALLSTLQYILGPDSGWQPVSLTEIITTAAVKKAYRKATLCVHPDKLQQRGATIHQKYICEKVFDLLKAAWNRFDSEER